MQPAYHHKQLLARLCLNASNLTSKRSFQVSDLIWLQLLSLSAEFIFPAEILPENSQISSLKQNAFCLPSLVTRKLAEHYVKILH